MTTTPYLHVQPRTPLTKPRRYDGADESGTIVAEDLAGREAYAMVNARAAERSSALTAALAPHAVPFTDAETRFAR